MMIRRGIARAAKAVPVISYVEEKEEKAVMTDLVTKEEVLKMPYFKLKSFAVKQGVDANGKKADTLRAEVIEKLCL